MQSPLYLAVDAAQFFLFHPEDCPDAGAELAPPNEALDGGWVVGLALGADGHRGLALVPGSLSEQDHKDVEPVPFVFPLHVRHGRLFATDRMADSSEYDWDTEPSFEVACGYYRASWYVLTDEAVERRNVNWLLHLEPVATLDGLPTWGDLPYEAGPRSPGVAPQIAARTVRHSKFGLGQIVAEGDGKVDVEFQDGQRRVILARFVEEV